jgi:hypothetical protein
MCGNELEHNVTNYNLFSHKMVVDFYMFGANMVDRIRSKSQGTDVVTPNDGSF